MLLYYSTVEMHGSTVVDSVFILHQLNGCYDNDTFCYMTRYWWYMLLCQDDCFA